MKNFNNENSAYFIIFLKKTGHMIKTRRWRINTFDQYGERVDTSQQRAEVANVVSTYTAYIYGRNNTNTAISDCACK